MHEPPKRVSRGSVVAGSTGPGQCFGGLFFVRSPVKGAPDGL